MCNAYEIHGYASDPYKNQMNKSMWYSFGDEEIMYSCKFVEFVDCGIL